MKKYLFPITISLFLGIAMAYFIIHQYESLDGIVVSKEAREIYFIQRGMYSKKENMEEDMRSFKNYIFSVEDNMYHAYVAVTTSKENGDKIVNMYKEENIETIEKKKIVDNSEFIEVLTQYDELLSKTNDKDTIKTINNQILSKYEEFVNGKH